MFSGLTAAVIGGGAALGYLGSQDAARSQEGSANAARALTQEQFLANKRTLQPWVDTGKAANAKLGTYLGITPKTQSGPDWDQYLRDNPDVAASATYANDPAAHYEQYGRKEGRGLPMFKAGPSPAATDPNFGSLLKPFTMADLTSEPGYQFGLSEGEKGIDRAAAAASGRYSGATLKALTRFNEEYAGTKYDAAFARDASTKNQTYNFLTGASGTGANAAAQTAGIGANSAATQAGLLTDAGNARAAGAVGGANAITGAISTGLNYYQGNSYIDALKKNTTALRGGATGTRAYSLQDEINL